MIKFNDIYLKKDIIEIPLGIKSLDSSIKCNSDFLRIP